MLIYLFLEGYTLKHHSVPILDRLKFNVFTVPAKREHRYGTVHETVKNGDFRELEMMVKAGASVNEVDTTKDRFTPIHWACHKGALEVALIVSLMLPQGGHSSVRQCFFWQFYTHPPPRNANNVDPYIFIMFFSGNITPSQPLLHYVTLEWPGPPY